jgi:hypothetical protein
MSLPGQSQGGTQLEHVPCCAVVSIGHLSSHDQPRLLRSPSRIFVSVDVSLGRSTLSFAPPDVGAPIQLEDDPDGEVGLARARELAANHPGAIVVGPHFHDRPVKGRLRRGRR